MKRESSETCTQSTETQKETLPQVVGIGWRLLPNGDRCVMHCCIPEQNKDVKSSFSGNMELIKKMTQLTALLLKRTLKWKRSSLNLSPYIFLTWTLVGVLKLSWRIILVDVFWHAKPHVLCMVPTLSTIFKLLQYLKFPPNKKQNDGIYSLFSVVMISIQTFIGMYIS